MIFAGLITSVLTPLVTAGITAWNKTKDVTMTAYTASAGVATAQAEYMKAVLGHPLSPPSIMCYAVAFWFFKAVAVDNVLCPSVGWECSTPALKGGTLEIAMIVVGGMFFSGIAYVWKRYVP
jgi:hypothetical protein